LQKKQLTAKVDGARLNSHRDDETDS
jgi:hypothetical protein